MSTVEQ